MILANLYSMVYALGCVIMFLSLASLSSVENRTVFTSLGIGSMQFEISLDNDARVWSQK